MRLERDLEPGSFTVPLISEMGSRVRDSADVADAAAATWLWRGPSSWAGLLEPQPRAALGTGLKQCSCCPAARDELVAAARGAGLRCTGGRACLQRRPIAAPLRNPLCRRPCLPAPVVLLRLQEEAMVSAVYASRQKLGVGLEAGAKPCVRSTIK